MTDKCFSCNTFIEFYVLESINYHLHYDRTLISEDKHFLPSTQYLDRELKEYKAEFEIAFALRLRDYLWHAALGEARHSQRVLNVVLEGMENVQAWSRGEVYQDFVNDFPPTPKNIEAVHNLFYAYSWDETYGGDNWANIVDAIKLYDEVEIGAFIDHCADLQHNGGVAFDKSVHFWNTDGYGNINNFLTFKFNAVSVVYDLPRFYHHHELRSKLSRKAVYLMNKLFAIANQSPWYDKTLRLQSNWWKYNMSLDNQYLGYDYTFGDVIESTVCYNCGHATVDPVYDEYNGTAWCHDCCTTCSDCGGIIKSGKSEYVNTQGDYICYDCSGEYSECATCYAIIDSDETYCKACNPDCDECGDDVEDESTRVYNLDKVVQAQAETTPLSNTTSDMCIGCIKKYLDAGYKFYKVDNKIYMSTKWNYLMSNPWGELLTLHMQDELSYYELLPQTGGYTYG